MKKIAQFMIDDLENLVSKAEFSEYKSERIQFLNYYKDIRNALKCLNYNLEQIKYLEDRVKKIK